VPDATAAPAGAAAPDATADGVETSRRGALASHLWTVWARVRHQLRGRRAPPAEPWQGRVEDPVLGPLRLTGRLRRVAGGDGEEAPDDGGLLILVHGLGGSTESHYMVRGALAAEAAGLACLRLNLRGADHLGEDYYHAALTADLHAALASPEVARYRRIYVLGYSLGGHLALRWATEPGDPRVASVAAVCSPLDLERAQEAIDGPAGWLYRRYLLRHLMRIYTAVAARRPVPLPVADAARLRRLRDFDQQIVAPRHGFASADDYYARASVGRRLAHLRLPALLANARHDPMVVAAAVRPAVAPPPPVSDRPLAATRRPRRLPRRRRPRPRPPRSRHPPRPAGHRLAAPAVTRWVVVRQPAKGFWTSRKAKRRKSESFV
jgi:predicted alpha/beta-fold hydrolase